MATIQKCECGEILHFSDDLAGANLNCPKCTQLIKVESASKAAMHADIKNQFDYSNLMILIKKYFFLALKECTIIAGLVKSFLVRLINLPFVIKNGKPDQILLAKAELFPKERSNQLRIFFGLAFTIIGIYLILTKLNIVGKKTISTDIVQDISQSDPKTKGVKLANGHKNTKEGIYANVFDNHERDRKKAVDDFIKKHGKDWDKIDEDLRRNFNKDQIDSLNKVLSKAESPDIEIDQSAESYVSFAKMKPPEIFSFIFGSSLGFPINLKLKKSFSEGEVKELLCKCIGPDGEILSENKITLRARGNIGETVSGNVRVLGDFTKICSFKLTASKE